MRGNIEYFAPLIRLIKEDGDTPILFYRSVICHKVE
jgi:hypothetical protein